MKPTIGKILKNVLLLVIGVLLGLGLVELGFRLMKGNTRPTSRMSAALDAYDDPEQFWKLRRTLIPMQYDSYLGYIPKAPFDAPDFHTNRDHFRYDHDFPQEKSPGEIRIFVTGGSTGWGVGVVQESNYARVMERHFAMDFPDRQVRVIPAAAGGYCTTQERILLENRLLPFGPDMVIMLSGWNDTYFGYRGKRVLLDNDFLNYRAQIESFPYRIHPLDPPDYFNYRFKLRYVFDLARYRSFYPTREILEKEIRERSIPVSETVVSLLHNVGIVADLSKRFGYQMIFYLQPCVYSTQKPLSDWEKHLQAWGEAAEIGFPEYLRQVYAEYRRQLPREAKIHDFLFFDADDAIGAEMKSVFMDTVHLGDRGNRLIGEYLYKKLIATGMPRNHKVPHRR